MEQRPLHSFFVSFYERFSQIVGFCSILSYSNLFYSVITWQYGNLQRTGSGIDQFVAILLLSRGSLWSTPRTLMLSRVTVHFLYLRPIDNYCVRQAGAGSWSWSVVREKYYYLAGGWSWRDVREKYCSAGG